MVKFMAPGSEVKILGYIEMWSEKIIFSTTLKFWEKLDA